uniref:Transposase n=1 Tax=Steinernema glaseri TaxID=37863 RepID=A0A1I7Z7Y8_9BILA
MLVVVVAAKRDSATLRAEPRRSVTEDGGPVSCARFNAASTELDRLTTAQGPHPKSELSSAQALRVISTTLLAKAPNWHCERRFRPSVRHLARFVLPRLLGICPTRRTAMIATVMISSIGPPRGPYPTRSRRRRRQHLTGCGRSEQIAAETAGLLTRRRRPSSPSARACLLAITAHCRLPYLHS